MKFPKSQEQVGGSAHCATFIIGHKLSFVYTSPYNNPHISQSSQLQIQLNPFQFTSSSISQNIIFFFSQGQSTSHEHLPNAQYHNMHASVGFNTRPQFLPFLINYPNQITTSSSVHRKTANQTSSTLNQSEQLLPFQKVFSHQKLKSTELDISNDQIHESDVEADWNLNATAERGVNDQDDKY
ncbi:MAG: hypothetical protein EZS28_010659 [Streblomastix strix]|uniref:Uncharacterized protein n=1 Tax=Streblomastix strix TaxID=222440 RepID=A0A5J4WHI2_9EUKA|nr:MAG: hypothetical protein EZS28_010659 [Streblomastix strix]